MIGSAAGLAWRAQSLVPGSRIIRGLMRTSHSLIWTCALATFAAGAPFAHAAAAQDDLKVTPGELVIEHPTLINLGFEWHIDGDANRNASVEVSYRKQGENAWKQAMPRPRNQLRRSGLP